MHDVVVMLSIRMRMVGFTCIHFFYNSSNVMKSSLRERQWRSELDTCMKRTESQDKMKKRGKVAPRGKKKHQQQVLPHPSSLSLSLSESFLLVAPRRPSSFTLRSISFSPLSHFSTSILFSFPLSLLPFSRCFLFPCTSYCCS